MNYLEIGKESLRAYIKTNVEVISGQKMFNSLIAASDSGHLALHITKTIYKLLDVNMPNEFIAPIFRHVDEKRTIIFNNAVLKDNYLSWEKRNLGSALFVDDEIWHANTLNGMLDLLKALDTNINDLTIIAEDGGFNCVDPWRGIPTKYFPTKKRIPNIYNAFSYIIPDRFALPVRNLIKNEYLVNEKHVMCTLLGLPVKDRKNGQPQFTFKYIDRANDQINNFVELQSHFLQWLEQEIINCM